MDSVQAVSLAHATPSDEPLLANLLELYVHDLSAIFLNVELGPDGRFGYPRLPLYWTEPGRFPFLIRSEGRIAGFILVQRVAETGPPVYDVAEFFVLRRYRRSGVGRQAALLLWNQLIGEWTVRVADSNHAAVAFWQSAIAAAVGGAVTQSAVVRDGRAWHVFAFTTTSP